MRSTSWAVKFHIPNKFGFTEWEFKAGRMKIHVTNKFGFMVDMKSSRRVA